MESRLAIPALQHWQHLGDFQHASWPAVDKEKRDGSFDVALLVYEMHINRTMLLDIDLNFVVGQRV